MTRPNFDQLFESAVAQEGLFTATQAAAAGYSTPLVHHHVHTGRFIRVQRGIYRLRHFPAGTHEGLVAVWLWSEQTGLFSHHTALSLHDLSDALPSKTHLTVPSSWRKRRVHAPPGVILHYADTSAQDRSWFESVPVTSPSRTVEDCARQGVSLETLELAVRQALQRGMLSREEIPNALQALDTVSRPSLAA
jgi:predicted transcriptional regulator of viral defense system